MIIAPYKFIRMISCFAYTSLENVIIKKWLLFQKKYGNNYDDYFILLLFWFTVPPKVPETSTRSEVTEPTLPNPGDYEEIGKKVKGS